MSQAHSLPLWSPPAAQPLPPSDQHGVVYTRPWVVALMLDLAGYTPTNDLTRQTAIEPAAGTGSFLLPMVERLCAARSLWGHPLQDTASALLALELDPQSVQKTQQDVIAVLRRYGATDRLARELADAWVQQGDYLAQAPHLPSADFVIGNPPYVRLEDIDPAVAAGYRQHYRTMVGRADLYVGFYEAALRALKPNGVCAFICADRWMLNQYGTELRRLITADFAVETVIELHRTAAFESDVSAYPAITLLRRAKQGAAVVARGEPGVEAIETRHLLQALTSGANGPAIPELPVTHVAEWFMDGAPWPCTSPERLALLKHLEATFPLLESAATGTRIGIGVATGADKIFITSDPHLVEQTRLLPLAMAASTKHGSLRWTGQYLVNPWNDQGLIDLADYPQLQTYLQQHEAPLRNRHVGRRNASGWYRTIDRVDTKLTGQPKLYIADIKDRLRPVLDDGTTYPHHNLYWVTSSTWDMEVLGGLLLSEVAQFFVECYGVRMRGGYLRFQAQYLRRIRVPDPQSLDPDQAEALRLAFRAQDQRAATAAALAAYGIAGIPSEGP